MERFEKLMVAFISIQSVSIVLSIVSIIFYATK